MICCCFWFRYLLICLHLCKIRCYSCVYLSFCIINDNWCSNYSLVNLCLHINNCIFLLVIGCDYLLCDNICVLEGIFKLGWKICWWQLKWLNSRIAFFQENIWKLLLHIKTYIGKILKEHWCLELGGLIVKCINSKSNAWAFVVLSISHIHSQKIFWIKLILELCSEVNHKTISWSGFNWSSSSICISREIKSLHTRWVLNEFMHETQVMESRSKNKWTYLFSNWWIVKSISVNT